MKKALKEVILSFFAHIIGSFLAFLFLISVAVYIAKSQQ